MAGDRKDGLETAILLLEILKRIPKMRKITTSELQKQLAAHGLERDVRTIQRHLETLIDRFDIERDDRAKPYGYRWKERAEGIALPSLSPKESLLLKMANDHLRSLLPPKLSKSSKDDHPFFLGKIGLVPWRPEEREPVGEICSTTLLYRSGEKKPLDEKAGGKRRSSCTVQSLSLPDSSIDFFLLS